jgi:predicted phage replisome organizer
MAEVKWIKIATDIFDNQKIKVIESMPEGDAIIVIWFKILMLAGNVNDGGSVYFTKDIPYTDQMLATVFNRPLTTIQLAINTFEKFGMIEVVDEIIQVSNWEKYQNVNGLDKIREQNRIRVARHREKKKLECNVTCNATVTQCNAIDIDIEKDIDIEEEKKKNDYQLIADMYNDTCVSFPRVNTLSEARKKAIKARLKIYTIDDFKRMFEMAEKSYFLKGGNDRNWCANFDWMIKDANMAKILDGNYNNNADIINRPNNYDKLAELERRAMNGM